MQNGAPYTQQVLLVTGKSYWKIWPADYRALSKRLFRKLGILGIYSLYSFHVGSFMYMYHHGMLPYPFKTFFLTGSQFHNYFTQSAESHCSHGCRTSNKQFTILYHGLKLWISLPFLITQSNNVRTFRQTYRHRQPKLITWICVVDKQRFPHSTQLPFEAIVIQANSIMRSPYLSFNSYSLSCPTSLNRYF